MANKFVYHLGGDTDGESWANAYATVAQGLAAVGAGEIIFAASDHAEAPGANTTWGSTNGTKNSRVKIISTNRSDDSFQTMLAGGGQFDLSGGWDLTLNGHDLWIGCDFDVGDNFSMTTDAGSIELRECQLKWDDDFTLGHTDGESWVILRDCDLMLDSPGGITFSSGRFDWIGGSFSFTGTGATTTLLRGPTNRRITVVIADVDFQGLDGSDFIFEGAGQEGSSLFAMKRCKVPAALGGFVDSAIDQPGREVKIHSCSSSDIVYQLHEFSYVGEVEQDTANYLNATADGTTGYSAKMMSSARAEEMYEPLRFKLAEFWASANPTLVIEMITSAVTLQNDEFWMEIEYPDATIGAWGKIDATSKMALLGTPANLTTSTAAWTEVLASEVKQKIEETISGGQAGIHTVWACLAKPSTTVYVDPKVTIS